MDLKEGKEANEMFIFDDDDKPYKDEAMAFPFPIYTNFPTSLMYNDDKVNQEVITRDVFRKQFWKKDQ